MAAAQRYRMVPDSHQGEIVIRWQSTWKSDKARRINRIVSGSDRDAFIAWCDDIADGFGEWAEQRDAGDPVSFADYCEDLLYWEDRTGWIQDYLASYFDHLPPRCHAVIVAEVRHAVSEMGAAR